MTIDGKERATMLMPRRWTASLGNDWVLFVQFKNLCRQERCGGPGPDKDYVLPFGRGRVVREGSDVMLVTWGNTVMISEDAARSLEEKISVEVIDLRTILPWDQEMVFKSIAKTNRCLVVHEDTMTMGFGAEVSARIMEEALNQLDAPVRRVAALDSFCPCAKPLENAVLPQKAGVIAAIEELVRW
jgi:2-oxoisovalerate dehydrogenase E1 component